ncbi:hypothetical protein ACJD0Z_08320 [Flavobacteriaceae bacterium M23B6Z8]
MIQKILFSLFLIFLMIYPYQGASQIEKVEGVYLGHLEKGYSFCYKTSVDTEEIIVFDEILSVILEKYPLHENKYLEQNFIVSFITNDRNSEIENKKTTTVVRLQKLLPGQHLLK